MEIWRRKIDNYLKRVSYMLMLNEFEIANFVAVVDSVELVKDVVDKELVFKQAM